MRVIWVRHGETEANRQGRYIGHLDPPINERGREQINQLCQQLAQEKLTALYTSDLTRCLQTAEAISATCCGIVPIKVDALRELSFGRWEGLTYSEIMERDPVLATRWYDDAFDVAPPHGETLRELGKRVDQWIDQELSSHLNRINEQTTEPGTIVVVTHGGVIRWVISRWLLGDPKQYWHVEGLAHGKDLITSWNGQVRSRETRDEMGVCKG